MGKAFAQILSNDQPHTEIVRNMVKNLDIFINKQAGLLNSRSLLLLGNGMKVLAERAPADALEKVKTMISDLIKKLQEDSAAEATQKAWCDDELSKNKKETETAEANIETHTARVAKIEGDINMLDQEIVELK